METRESESHRGKTSEGAPPTRVFSEKRLQAIENKALGCGIVAKERSKRRQALRRKGLGRTTGLKVKGLVGYFMGYYTMWLAPVKSFFVPFWELGKKRSALSAKFDNPIAGLEARLKGGPKLLEGGEQR